MSFLSNSAFDIDGDSLVYSLESPLNACGTADTYAPYPVPAITPISTSPACVLQSSVSANYTSALPIYVDSDTTGVCPLKTATPRFGFDIRTGTISMQPARYLPTTSSAGDNKYAGVVKISEYAALAAATLLVGTMRRELYFVVYDCGSNVMPRIAPNVTVQVGVGNPGTTQPLGNIISTLAGEPCRC